MRQFYESLKHRYHLPSVIQGLPFEVFTFSTLSAATYFSPISALTLSNPEHLCPTYRTHALGCRSSILHGDAFSILYFSLGAAFHTVSLHFYLPPLLIWPGISLSGGHLLYGYQPFPSYSGQMSPTALIKQKGSKLHPHFGSLSPLVDLSLGLF